MTYYPPPPKKRNTPLIITLAVLGVLVAGLCCFGGLALIGSQSDKPTIQHPTVQNDPPVTPSPSKKASTPSKAAAPTGIGGNDVVQVGSDVPAGTYRTATPVNSADTCYWEKSSDAEGSNIIDNGIPSGGRPQVTLTKGQWFTSRDCPDWVKK